jgi:transcriptional regulator with XRE-family HTH domain
MAIRTLADVGAAVRQAREEGGITQVQLAAQISTSPGLISRFERGSGNIGLSKFLEVLAAVNLRLELHQNDQGHPAEIRDEDDEIDLEAIINSGLKSA